METNYRALFEAARRVGTALSNTPVEQLASAVRTAAGLLRTHTDEILAANTGQTVEKVAQDTERDKWMTAQEAMEYGIVDQIITNKNE